MDKARLKTLILSLHQFLLLECATVSPLPEGLRSSVIPEGVDDNVFYGSSNIVCFDPGTRDRLLSLGCELTASLELPALGGQMYLLGYLKSKAISNQLSV